MVAWYSPTSSTTTPTFLWSSNACTSTTTATTGTITFNPYSSYRWVTTSNTTADTTTDWYWDGGTIEFTPQQTFVPAAPAILRRRSRWHRYHVEHEEREAQRQLAAQQEQTRIRARAEIVRVEQVKKIKLRARELLDYHLTPEQRRSIEQHGWFVVIGGKSGKRYRIVAANDNFAGNVHELDGERVTHRLCCHCDHTIPFGDQILAQKLMLENAEEDFLKLANRNAA